ncbi:hypothetical protein N0V94_000826 [Neodidymelliopsis sp. IMI 364377]|nr:hypothetical protein N0V94_000826 [Neodidymelliopsis sp. IMI 364377]
MTQSLPVDQAHLLAGMVPEATVAIGDSIDGTLSMGTHSFSHPQFVSFTGRSTSDASQVSPSTNALDVQVPQMDVPSSCRSDVDTSNANTFSQSMEGRSAPAAGRRKSSNISPTDADANRSSAKKSNHDHNAMAQLQVSNAPQTKSEQQQHQAHRNLSRINVNIEEIVLSVLSAEQQESSSHEIPSLTLSDAKKMQVSRAIADMVKQKTKPVRPQQRRSPQLSTSSMQCCRFENCNFSGRTCDLNKHMKRHRKPYGCTYPKCHKRFGAKSDWKRHENSQHFQLEAYRCDYPNNAGQKCGQHCYRTALFQKHLTDKHKVTSGEKMHADLKRCRIGKNCQVQYWCGFCREIKTLKNKRNAAWDERFDHIAEHFEKKKDSIDDWLCVEENRTKRQLQEEVDRTAFPDEESGDLESDESGGDGAVSTTCVKAVTIPRPQASSQKGSHKRPVPTDPREETGPLEKRVRSIYWYCVCD